MISFFIGCSFTYGDDLENPENDSWPAIVSRKTNTGMVNRAVSGGTNDRILYETIKHVDQFDKFYIAWTSTTRFTRYRIDNNHEVNFNPSMNNQLYKDRPEFIDYSKLHYAFWHNELFVFKIWLQQIILLQRYLESKNKPYMMISVFDNHIKEWTTDWQRFNDSVKSLVCFDQMDDGQLFAEHQEIQNLQNQLDRERFLGWGKISFRDIIQDCPKGATGHPLAQGHQRIADYILTHDTN